MTMAAMVAMEEEERRKKNEKKRREEREKKWLAWFYNCSWEQKISFLFYFLILLQIYFCEQICF